MRLISHPSPLAASYALALALIATLATGCSGINASKSVSPIDFLLPGLMQDSPGSPVLALETNAVPWLAQARPVLLRIQQQPNSQT
ncbi:MAG: hypothetical protein ACLQU3_07430 [Limisphaerales bacterium]